MPLRDHQDRLRNNEERIRRLQKKAYVYWMVILLCLIPFGIGVFIGKFSYLSFHIPLLVIFTTFVLIKHVRSRIAILRNAIRGNRHIIEVLEKTPKADR